MKFTQRSEIVDWLHQHLPPKRVQHILRVEAMAEELAQIHHLSKTDAAMAGLLHDLAKCYPPENLLAIAQQHWPTLHPVEVNHPHLLHGPVGAIEAQRLFNIDQPSVLQAIQNHTLGQPEMDGLSCVIFLADSLEPGRGKSEKMQHLRDLCSKSLYRAVAKTCEYQLKKLMKRNLPIHPRMVDTRNWAIAQDLRKDDKLNP